MKPVARAQDSAFTLGLGPEAREQYVYKPLQTSSSIRVIEWPRSLVGTSDLRCSFRVIDLDDPGPPEFTALSYTWGGWNGVEADDIDALDDLFTNTIICEGSRLRVTENAHRALCELYWRGRACLFWVDAVCINQEDNDERTQQVAMMGRIYASAVRTMVWLGEDDEDAQSVHELVQKTMFMTRDPHPRDLDISADSRFVPLDEPTDILRLLDESLSSYGGLSYGEGSHLITFFARPWFQRLWVVQEVVLAQDTHVICGKYTFSWEFLAYVVLRYLDQSILRRNLMDEIAQKSLRGRSTVVAITCISQPAYFEMMLSRFGFRSGTEKFSVVFGTLIQVLQNNLASDSRDRIYAPLALAMQLCDPAMSAQLRLHPRYDLPIEAVFLSAARYILERSSSLYILSLCKGRRSSHMPTWVPDFSAPSRQKSISSRLVWNAGLDSGAHNFRFSIEEPESGFPGLRVSGGIEGVVDQVSAPLAETIAASRIHSLLEFACYTANSTPSDDGEATCSWNLLKFLDLISISPNSADSSSFTHSYFKWLAFKLTLSVCKGTLSFDAIDRSLRRRFSLANYGLKRANCPSQNPSAVTGSNDDSPVSQPLELSAHDSCGHEDMFSLATNIIRVLRPGQVCKGSLKDWWPTIKTFQASLIPVITDRSLLRLTNGTVGLGPKSALNGDQIWFLDGAVAPIVLRPTDRAGQFEVIGEAYVPEHVHNWNRKRKSRISLI